MLSLIIEGTIIITIAYCIARLWSYKAFAYIKYTRQLEKDNAQLLRSNKLLVSKNVKLEDKLTLATVKNFQLTVNRNAMRPGVIVKGFNGYPEQDLMMLSTEDIINITGIELKQ